MQYVNEGMHLNVILGNSACSRELYTLSASTGVGSRILLPIPSIGMSCTSSIKCNRLSNT